MTCFCLSKGFWEISRFVSDIEAYWFEYINMVVKNVKVRNEAGIHCRPSSLIIQKVFEYPECSFSVECPKGEADLTSILGLMSLGLEAGEEVKITADGTGDEEACRELAELFANEFDFLPQK